MPVKKPTRQEMADVCQSLRLHMSAAQVDSFIELMSGPVAAYNALELMPEDLPRINYPRTPGYQPVGKKNKYNAWYYKTTIRGAPSGKLKGKRIVLKDNVCLAGVPMMNGASTLQGYTPDVDATVATRILDAGGTIVGKAVCEYFCFSGGSHTSCSGPVHNPHRMGYSAGGSSSGSGCLVALGECDMALGGDQGGSIRVPSAFCGVYGMKPTHGLVPYTGVMPIELTIDHVGPITGSVEDNALLLEVLAGPDGLDPRQYGGQSQPYRDALRRGVAGLRIGVVEDGFGHAQSMSQVDSLVREAAELLKGMGAKVENISIPMHLLGLPIWLSVAAEGATVQMMQGNGFGFNWQGLYLTSLMDFHSNWRMRANELADTLKNTMLLGHYMTKHYRGHYYAKGQNLVRRLRAAYDDALAAC